jgi:hypothetical protein
VSFHVEIDLKKFKEILKKNKKLKQQKMQKTFNDSSGVKTCLNFNSPQSVRLEPFNRTSYMTSYKLEFRNLKSNDSNKTLHRKKLTDISPRLSNSSSHSQALPKIKAKATNLKKSQIPGKRPSKVNMTRTKDENLGRNSPLNYQKVDIDILNTENKQVIFKTLSTDSLDQKGN